MTTPTPAAIDQLIEAAAALLEARSNGMVTSAEWRELREALVECGRAVPLDGADDPD